MTSNHSFQTGHALRGAPMLRRPPGRRPVFLAVLALAALAQAGCQSGFYGPCGSTPCGRPFPLWGTGFFRPRPVVTGGDCCPPGVIGAPVTTGPVMMGPGVPIGSSAVQPVPGLTPVPSGDSSSGIEPIPSAVPAGPPPTTGSSPTTGARPTSGKANYEARQPANGNSQARVGTRAGGTTVARTVSSTPAPTTRSAQGSRDASSREPVSNFSELDNLPPLAIPADTSSGGSTTPPIPPAAEREKAPSAVTTAVPTPSADVTTEPGIRRFSGVDSKLAGGSVPDTRGLDWLVEKGYRTLLDLRESQSVSSDFLGNVDRHGLRYVSLPITLKTLDAAHIARFKSELALADARPLYFFDTDGTRASALWYVHKVAVGHVDRIVARREAEEIGPRDDALWKMATEYLDSLVPAPTPVMSTKTASIVPASNNSTPSPELPPDATDKRPAPRDPASWKPLAVLAVTAVAAPLAYYSSSAIPSGFRLLARASLPGPRRSTKSLPHELDV